MRRRSRLLRGSGRDFKNYRKNRFSLQQLPKKGHFLKEMHKKKIAFGAGLGIVAELYRWTPGGVL